MKKLLLLSLLVILVLTACGAGSSSTTSNQDTTLAPVPGEFAGRTNPFGAEAATDGAKVFHTNCEPCHGASGHGDGFAGQSLDPKPKNLAELQLIAKDDYLFWRISEGREGTAMVGWKGVLTDDQIWQVVSFIRTMK